MRKGKLDWRKPTLRFVEAVPLLRRNLLASCDYVLLPEDPGPGEAQPASRPAPSGWDVRRTARRQDRAWSRLTREALAGDPRVDIQAVLDAIAPAPNAASVLEVGCGTGYFSDIIENARPDLSYTGVDYSPVMIQLAREERPGRTFIQGDATDLPFPEDTFDLTVDGAALIHIPQWRQALSEYMRVTRGSLVLSSLTVADVPVTRLVRKLAYGSPVIELVFSRAELSKQLTESGWNVVHRAQTLQYDLDHYIGIPTTSETWICR